jgi:beta-lactamase superfamily II metal-dependent hydrolase
MRLQIFDVEHGACALLTCDNDARVMLDCGHNSETGWYPGTYLRQNGIQQIELLVITNYDEDHASGLENLLANVNVRSIARNRSVSPAVIRQLKSEDGMGPGIERLVHELSKVYTVDGGPSDFAGLEWNLFYNSYPRFDDENNLSCVTFLKCNGRGVLFPGDLEKAGWLELLKREDFKQALRDTQVLVASHHGRENGCCGEIFHYCSPFYVVISDKGYMYDTQKTIPFYRGKVRGGPFRGETRHVLTTRRDGRIGFNFGPGGWAPY